MVALYVMENIYTQRQYVFDTAGLHDPGTAVLVLINSFMVYFVKWLSLFFSLSGSRNKAEIVLEAKRVGMWSRMENRHGFCLRWQA